MPDLLAVVAPSAGAYGVPTTLACQARARTRPGTGYDAKLNAYEKLVLFTAFAVTDTTMRCNGCRVR
jgi:hypothetical protein